MNLNSVILINCLGHIKISLIIDEDVQRERASIAQHNSDDVMGGEEAWIPALNSEDNNGNSDNNTNTNNTNNSNDNNKGSPNKGDKDEVNGVSVKGCFLKITIEDSGIGMTPEEQSRIFTRFSQANNRTAKVSDLLALFCIKH